MRSYFSIFSIATAMLFVASVQADNGNDPIVVALSGNGQENPQYSQRDIIRRGSVAGSRTMLAGASNVEFAFDAGNEKVSAVQFLISSDVDLSLADLSNCASMLPDTHVGGCKVKDEDVLFYAFSPVNAPLPNGVLGSISVNGERNIQVDISDQVMADVNGVELDGIE